MKKLVLIHCHHVGSHQMVHYFTAIRHLGIFPKIDSQIGHIHSLFTSPISDTRKGPRDAGALSSC